jgi:DNA-binding transcriptional ArsR family regulator
MHVSRPHAAVCPSLEGDVLVTLAGTHRPLTGRELARLVRRGSQTGVQRALGRLVEHGIVEGRQAGRAILYVLNRQHLAAPAVQALSGLRNELVRRLADEFTHWELPPVHASLFGSSARGDGDASSDIDIFLVRPTQAHGDEGLWREQTGALAARVRRWTGNSASLSEVGEADLPRLRSSRPRIVQELERDAVPLFGLPVSRVFGEGR